MRIAPSVAPGGKPGRAGPASMQIRAAVRAVLAEAEVSGPVGVAVSGGADSLALAAAAAAIAGETHEYTDMYPGMAKSARDEGFDEIADWFETLAKAERSHANRFQKALDAL